MSYLESMLASHPLQPVHLLALLFAIAFGKSTMIISSFLPPASVMLLAVILLSLPQVDALSIWLSITCGAASGSICTYHLGRAAGRWPRCARLIARYAHALEKAGGQLERHGFWALFISRFLAVLRYLIPLAAGLLLLKRGWVYAISLGSAALWAAMFMAIAAGGAQFLPAF